MSYIKCVIIVCFTFFPSILSPFQTVSFIKCMIIVCLTVFFFYHVTISDGELDKLHDYCVFDFYLFNLSPFQTVSYIKCVIIVFDSFLFL